MSHNQVILTLFSLSNLTNGVKNVMDRSFISGRIISTKAQIVVFEDAAVALGTGQIQSYTIDTGQTRQVVTRMNLTELEKAIYRLYNLCAMLEARLTGGNVVTVRPAW